MQQKFFDHLAFCNDLYENDSCLVVGAGIELLENITDIFGSIFVVEADNERKEKISRIFNDLNIKFINELIYKDLDKVKFYIMNNSSANNIENLEKYEKLFPNINVKRIQERDTVSIKNLLVKYNDNKNIKFLIINTLNSFDILKNNDFNNFEIIACKILNEEVTDVKKLFEENDFKLLKIFEKPNPNILWAVFVKDYKKFLFESLNEIKQKDEEFERLKNNYEELELLIKQKEQKIKDLLNHKEELEEKVINLENIIKEKNLQNNKLIKEKEELLKTLSINQQETQDIKFEIDKLQKAKENLLKEIEELNKKLENNDKNYKEKLEKLSKELHNQEDTNKKLNIELENYKSKNENLETIIAQDKEVINNITEQLNKLEENKKISEKKEKELEDKINEISRDNEEYKKSISKLKVAKVELEKKLSSKVTELQDKEKKINELIKYKNQLIEELKNSQFLLKEIPFNFSKEVFYYINLAENSFLLKEYKKSIQYWNKIAAILEDKMPPLYYRRLHKVYQKLGGFPLASDEEERISGKLDKYRFLEQFHNIIQPKFYFEIGVQGGKSISYAKCKALGVDPMPLLNKELPMNIEILSISSDDFFKFYAKEKLKEAPDLVFIDGMHLFEFVLRDFINVEKFSNKNTIVLIDDIFPGHPTQACRERKTRAWTGDVWKIVEILKKYRNDLELTLLDIYPTGILMINNLDSKNEILVENYENIVNEFCNKEISNEYIDRKNSIDPDKILNKFKQSYKK